MTPFERTEKIIKDKFREAIDIGTDWDGLHDEVETAIREAVAEEREAIASMIENHRATNDDGDPLYDLGHWESEWYVLDSEKIAAAIRSRP